MVSAQDSGSSSLQAITQHPFRYFQQSPVLTYATEGKEAVWEWSFLHCPRRKTHWSPPGLYPDPSIRRSGALSIIQSRLPHHDKKQRRLFLSTPVMQNGFNSDNALFMCLTNCNPVLKTSSTSGWTNRACVMERTFFSCYTGRHREPFQGPNRNCPALKCARLAQIPRW